jgi:hypothetical protein
MLAPARHVDWDAVGHEVENDIIQALNTDNDFTSSENEQSQCFYACRILRIERTLTVPYFLIGRVLTIDKGIVSRHFKWGLAHPDSPGANGRPSLLSYQQLDQLIEALCQGGSNAVEIRRYQRLYRDQVSHSSNQANNS